MGDSPRSVIQPVTVLWYTVARCEKLNRKKSAKIMEQGPKTHHVSSARHAPGSWEVVARPATPAKTRLLVMAVLVLVLAACANPKAAEEHFDKGNELALSLIHISEPTRLQV